MVFPRAVAAFILIGFLICSCFNPIGACAESAQQKEPSSEEMQELMSAMMGPMMARMMESMMETMLKILAKPESAEQLATFSKNFYDALIAKGFSKEDALRIVVSIGMPSIPSMK